MTNDKRMSAGAVIDLDGLRKLAADTDAHKSVQIWNRELRWLLTKLSAARTVEDAQVEEFIEWLRLEASWPGRDAGTVWRFETTADLLTRLSVAKAQAERVKQLALEEATTHRSAVVQAERERDEARGNRAAVQALLADTLAKLATAREAALEEAAKVADEWATVYQRQLGNGGPAAAIRALSTAPDTGKETQ